MNCPECRKKLWYWAELSKPKEGPLVYVCQECDILYGFLKMGELPKALASWRGARIVRMVLAKRNYTLPPVTQGSILKPSPQLAKGISAHPSKRGEG
jgi:hypothetical protein